MWVDQLSSSYITGPEGIALFSVGVIHKKKME